jgi:hypothetical protein
MKKIIATAIAAACVCGVAQAQTTIDVPDFVNQTIYTGTLYQTSFAVGGDLGNVLIEGSATAAPNVTGIVLVTPLAGGAPVVEDLNFAAGNTTGNYNFQFQNLSAGAYELGYEFSTPDNSVVPVGFAASVESTYAAPEIDSASAVAGLTLLVGGLLVFRGRRTTTPTFA